MTLRQFLEQVRSRPRPVILLEGTRSLPPHEKPLLAAFARQLALRLPCATFRSGNAPGSDDAFAEGVASVDAGRLEIVLPDQRHRATSMPPGAIATAITDIHGPMLRELADTTGRATPRHGWLAQKYTRDRKKLHPKPAAIIRLILRDTLKVAGDPTVSLEPATIGIFRENPDDPEAGGTGHTIRCCRELRVPVLLQRDWFPWVRQ